MWFVLFCVCCFSWRITLGRTVPSGTTRSAQWWDSGLLRGAGWYTATTRTPPAPAHISPTSLFSWAARPLLWASHTEYQKSFFPLLSFCDYLFFGLFPFLFISCSLLLWLFLFLFLSTRVESRLSFYLSFPGWVWWFPWCVWLCVSPPSAV